MLKFVDFNTTKRPKLLLKKKHRIEKKIYFGSKKALFGKY